MGPANAEEERCVTEEEKCAAKEESSLPEMPWDRQMLIVPNT
jgi:hypothetical protein